MAPREDPLSRAGLRSACRLTLRSAMLVVASVLVACGAAPMAAQTAPRPAPKPEPALADAPHLPGLTNLKGLKQAEIVALLGEPDFRRADPPAELWQYRAEDCILDLYFYRGGDGFRVADAETRGRSLNASRAGDCPDNEVPFRDRPPHAPL
jgi:hypothetical protein